MKIMEVAKLLGIPLSRAIGDHDLVIIGGGVAGYVAAIKAGQEGLKAGSKENLSGNSAIRCKRRLTCFRCETTF
jgi:heterodisulfide reductase subunit A-like polyferredoxin